MQRGAIRAQAQLDKQSTTTKARNVGRSQWLPTLVTSAGQSKLKGAQFPLVKAGKERSLK